MLFQCFLSAIGCHSPGGKTTQQLDLELVILALTVAEHYFNFCIMDWILASCLYGCGLLLWEGRPWEGKGFPQFNPLQIKKRMLLHDSYQYVSLT